MSTIGFVQVNFNELWPFFLYNVYLETGQDISKQQFAGIKKMKMHYISLCKMLQ